MDLLLQTELLRMRQRDELVRSRLASQGSLFDGYAPEMERVHRENALRLDEIVRSRGWPGYSLVGEPGCAAAFLVAQHAIGEPPAQRHFLERLQEAVQRGDAPARYLAQLDDRIRFNEGRPQRYGTVLDWDDDGLLSPGPVENPARIDDLRAASGLPPLSEAIKRARDTAAAEGERPPADPAARRKAQDAWARRVGWR